MTDPELIASLIERIVWLERHIERLDRIERYILTSREAEIKIVRAAEDALCLQRTYPSKKDLERR